MPALGALNLREFRLFSRLEFSPEPKTNLIVGENGGGKTSIMEAIYYVCRGRSFRTRRSEDLVRHGGHSCTIQSAWREDENRPFSIRAQLGEQPEMRIQGSPLQRRAALFNLVPLMAVTPANLDLVSCPPARRRSFLNGLLRWTQPGSERPLADWALCMRERNTLLSSHSPKRDELNAWDQKLIQLATELEEPCQDLAKRLAEELQETLQFWNLPDVRVVYERGWPRDKTFAQALEQARVRDTKLGFSTCGMHRADLCFLMQRRGTPASRYLSGGQGNLLSLSLFFAAHRLLTDALAKSVPLILDDILQRFDHQTCVRLAEFLRRRDHQIFLTAAQSPMEWENLARDGRWRLAGGALSRF